MWKYITAHYKDISLHDCIIDEIQIRGDDIILVFNDGFYIAKTNPLNKTGMHKRTTKSQITLRNARLLSAPFELLPTITYIEFEGIKFSIEDKKFCMHGYLRLDEPEYKTDWADIEFSCDKVIFSWNDYSDNACFEHNKKQIIPPYFIFKPDNMSGFLYHVLILISIAWCAAYMTAVFTDALWRETVSVFSISIFFITATICFILTIMFYSTFTFYSEKKSIARRVFNFLFALVYAAVFWCLPVFFSAISEKDTSPTANIVVVFILIVPIIYTLEFCLSIFDYRRYIKSADTNAKLLSQVDEYILQKYPNEEILKEDKNFSIHFAVKKKGKIYYDPLNNFAISHKREMNFPCRDYEFLRFPKNAHSNCLVDVSIWSKSPENKKFLAKFSVYIKNGEFSDDYRERIAHNEAENKIKPIIQEYLVKKYPETIFAIGQIRNGKPDHSTPKWLDKREIAAPPLDSSGDFTAFITPHTSKIEDEIKRELDFHCKVWRINGEFFDDFMECLNEFLKTEPNEDWEDLWDEYEDTEE